ncbi:hypothetical protein AND_000137 [Anopheles darlingi]|uniref:Uncharacterized protein n=1 Tax=Anopheles darlingi TaxID=43151 RepID=W5JV54_ANODA|nr:hypothetical protein AND_000137 [Anopheles darlingi]
MWFSKTDFNWIPWTSHQGVPPRAVHAGNDPDGSLIYVGRAHHEGDLLPAKVIPSKKICYVSHNGADVSKSTFEVLIGSAFTWVPSVNGQIPGEAVLGGRTATGEQLYIGRTHQEGSLIPGEIHRSDSCLYILFDGTEHSFRQYEVLTGSSRSTWKRCSAHAPLPLGAILAGKDSDGSPIFIGRAYHAGDLLPAKVIPSKHAAYVSHAGDQTSIQTYEVLCNGDMSWVPCEAGYVPPKAVVGGRTDYGELLYIGRARYRNTLTPGKIHPSLKTLYIAYGGNEISIDSYEALVEN